MDGIKIPHEKTKPEKTNKKIKKSKKSLIQKIRQKLKLKEVSRDEKTVGKTCIKLIRYVAESNKFNIKDINDLLDDMERSILSLQRSKKQKIEKAKKKR